jgi:hypothetical protein
MATFIKVSSSEEQLLRRNREEVQGNRLQKVEADQQAAAGKDIAASTAQQKLLLQPGGNGRRGVRFKRDEPAAAVSETLGETGLWKTQPTDSEYVNFAFAGWFGVEFTAASSFTIRYLGGFDYLENGLQVRYPIRVWRRKNNGDLELIADELLAQGARGLLAGAYRFTKVKPVQVQNNETIVIAINYGAELSAENQVTAQEDRYQFSVGAAINGFSKVVEANPKLIQQVRVVEDISAGSFDFDVTNGTMGAVSVNFSIGRPIATRPPWA